MTTSPADADARVHGRDADPAGGRRAADGGDPGAADRPRDADTRATERRGGRTALAAGLVSLLIHAALALGVYLPRPDEPAASGGSEQIRVVEIPPRLEVPSAPPPVRRPPAPEPKAVTVDAPVSAAATPVPEPPADPAPRPPEVTAVTPDARPTLARADVPPVMEAPDELRDRLRRRYPDDLRELRRGGVVELRFFVARDGDVGEVEVTESSGHGRLDRAAARITREVNFLPGLVRDRAVGLWVSQRICFVVVDDPDDVPSPEECEQRVAVTRR